MKNAISNRYVKSLLKMKLNLQINLVNFSDVLNDFINIYQKNVIIHCETVLSTCADLA
jgi:hypothetical protein